jgi:uncharacterized protein YecE (DUF72 family)
MPGDIRIGTAGWNIPKQHAAEFPDEGTHLERYARRFRSVEINSSFYRSHLPRTYARWAASVPPGFRFAVKLPREISHVRRLAAATEPLENFLTEVRALGDRLGPLLVQLPPSLVHEPASAGDFFAALRARFDGDLVCEPRHPSWFAAPVDAMLSRFHVARVAADPAPAPGAAVPGGWPGLVYHRLHGSPRMYYSGYAAADLDETAQMLRGATAPTRESWCILDNTAVGNATGDALRLADLVRN